jgi:hypothetical protein
VAARAGGLDKHDVGLDVCHRHPLVPLLCDVPEPLHRMREEIGDLAIGIDDEDLGHDATVVASRVSRDEVR